MIGVGGVQEMGQKRKNHSKEFKAKVALEAVKGTHSLSRSSRPQFSLSAYSPVGMRTLYVALLGTGAWFYSE